MKRYQAVIFDWDGTLANSTAQIVRSMQYAAKSLNLPLPTAEKAKEVIGLSLMKAMQTLAPGLEEARYVQLANAYRAHYMGQKRAKTVLFEHAQAVLECLQPHFDLAIATGKSRAGLELALEDTGVGYFFKTTCTVDECLSKPNPEMVLKICDYFNVSTKNVVVVGDTAHDLEMANNAGADAIGVATGAHTSLMLHAAKPLCVLENLTTLPTLLLGAKA